MKKRQVEKEKKHNYKIIIGLLLGLVIGSIGVYAATQIASSNVTYTNNNQENVQGAIDDLYNKTKDYNVCNANRNVTTTKKCKRAEYLHQETCNKTNESYNCRITGYSLGSTITYGNCGTSGTLASGDAFDCDVNGDGVYNADTERFYYVSNYYNTTTKQFENDTAVLIYYNNVSGGTANNTAKYAYHSGNINYEGPVTAIAQLPTTNQWSNVSLKNTNRAILNENAENTSNNGIYQLPESYSYAGYSARLLTYQEIALACNNFNLNNCQYLMENTQYSKKLLPLGYWLETVYSKSSSYTEYVDCGYNTIYRIACNEAQYSLRPVIEVSVTDIEY